MTTKIEWVKNPDGTQGITLNPIKGMCPMACPYCYARRMYVRYKWNKTPEFNHTVLSHTLDFLKKPTGIFLCSTFEWLWDNEWATNIIYYINQYPQHRFYLLTKKPEKLAQFSPFPDNAWVGVSVCNNKMLDVAVVKLEDITAKVKFISFEPLLEKMKYSLDYAFYYSGISWVIIGAQTPFSKKTAPKAEWIKEIVEAADIANIPVFLKNNLLPILTPVYEEAGCINNFFKSGDGIKPILRQDVPNPSGTEVR